MTPHVKPGWRERVARFIEKNPVVAIAYVLMFLAFLIIFAPEAKQVFTYYTHIPLSQDAKNSTMIMEKLDQQSNRGRRLDTVIAVAKHTDITVSHLDTNVALLVSMMRNTPTGQRMIQEYRHYRRAVEPRLDDGFVGNPDEAANFGHIARKGGIASNGLDPETLKYCRDHPEGFCKETQARRAP